MYNSLTPHFFDRAYMGRSPNSADGALYRVRNFSFSHIGGPESAEIEVVGDWSSCFAQLGRLREPVIISDDAGNRVWWGYVSEVRAGADAIALDGMANKIAGKAGGTLGTWFADPDSIATYGIKELIIDAGSTATVSEADAIAQSELELRSKPVAYTTTLDIASSPSATIYCRGWWDTLSWQYITTTGTAGNMVLTANAINVLWQFFTHVSFVPPSAPAVATRTQYETLRYNVERWLSAGAATSPRGVNVTMSPRRSIDIAPHPTKDRAVTVDRYDDYYTEGRSPIYHTLVPQLVGRWAVRADGHGVGQLPYVNNRYHFIARMTYNAQSGRNVPTTRSLSRTIDQI